MKNKDFTKREKDQLVEGLMRRAGLGKYARKFVTKRDGLIKEGYDPLHEQDDEDEDEDLGADPFGDDMGGPVDGGAPDAADLPADLPPDAGADVTDPTADLGLPDETGLGLESGTPPAQVTPEQVAKAVVDALKSLNLVSYEDESADGEAGLGDDLAPESDLDLNPPAPAPEGEGETDLSVTDDGMGDEEVDLSVSDEDEEDDFDVEKLAEAIVRAVKKNKK